MRLSVISIISFCVIISIIVAVFIYQLQPPVLINNSTTQIILDIEPGLSFIKITEKLKQSGLIRSEIVFKIYSLITGQAHHIKAGKYFFPISDKFEFSTPELVKILVAGQKEIKVVIFPGMTLKEIDERLANLKVIERNELINFNVSLLKNYYLWLPSFENNPPLFGEYSINALEGFLLPDTYYFFPSEIDLTIKKILDNFKLRALPLLINNDVDILNSVILASLLEKEIPDNMERRIAAGVLNKRLSIGMPLQIDATIVYIKCRGRFLNCPTILREDFKIDSLYNTYLYLGLPPAPISNPSVEAIKAAINPIKTDYWYFLSDPETKKTIFSKTFDEHNKNRVKYLGK